MLIRKRKPDIESEISDLLQNKRLRASQQSMELFSSFGVGHKVLDLTQEGILQTPERELELRSPSFVFQVKELQG